MSIHLLSFLFSFDLQYVKNVFPDGRSDIPVGNLISTAAHDDVHPIVEEQTTQDSPNIQVIETPVAVPVSSSASHDDMLENVSLSNSASAGR